MGEKSNYKKDKIIIFIYYVVAFIISYLTIKYLPISNLYLLTFVADVISTIFIYIMSIIHKNTSIYDPYWSVYPLFIVIYWFSLQNISESSPSPKQIILILLVLWYATRLTTNWAKYWSGFGHEDWRYTRYRKSNPKIFQIINFGGLQMMPTIWVFLGCMSFYPALSPNKKIGALDIIGIVIIINAILFETFADIQMHKFLKIKQPGENINTGLWKYSRHPNYFGEVTLWWGFWFLGISSNPSIWWQIIIGPIAITVLFIFISIPMMEKHNLEKRLQYKEYQEKVSMIIPWFPKK